MRLLGTWNSPKPSPLTAGPTASGKMPSATGTSAEKMSPSASSKPPAVHSLADPNRSARRLATELVIATASGQQVMMIPALTGLKPSPNCR